MARPSNVRYLKSHEWARQEDSLVTVGISDFAVDALNKEIVYIELPEVGKKVQAGDSFGVIESVKAASDMYAPVAGVIEAVNDAVVDDPNLVSDSPYENGWLIKISPEDTAQYDALLSPEQYEEVVAEESH